MNKKKIITSCWNCLDMDKNIGCCKLLNRPITNYKFPEWCPLPDDESKPQASELQLKSTSQAVCPDCYRIGKIRNDCPKCKGKGKREP